ncbi:MAG: hypothetical protein HY301_01600 [Verrucomicrobia bacterium]|nr:hypothetical protein [Verrucomicrobiota bacterium]
MSLDASLLFGSAWLALFLAAAGESWRRPRTHDLARVLWTLGGLALVLHLVFAFQFRHHWSHAAAVADTARQTREFTGLDWGGGVWVNYFFAALWLADAAWWWLRPESFADARRWLLLTRLFFLFMWLNATVIFVSGPQRWLGLTVCAAAVLARYGARRMR